MKIFVIYDGEMVWKHAFPTFEEAVDAVRKFVSNFNDIWKRTSGSDDNEWPAIMESEFKTHDEQGGIFVAFNEATKLSTFIKELIV
jgi:hypothetical protein